MSNHKGLSIDEKARKTSLSINPLKLWYENHDATVCCIMIWESWCNSLLPDVIFEFSPLYMCIIYNPLKFVVGCYSWVFTIIYCEFNLLKFFLTFTFLLSFHMIYKSEKKLWFELYGRARNIVYQVFEFDEAFRNMY